MNNNKNNKKRVHFTLPEFLIDRLEQESKKCGYTKTVIVQSCLTGYLDMMDKHGDLVSGGEHHA